MNGSRIDVFAGPDEVRPGFTLRQLEAFVATAHAGSFAAAAQTQHVTSSAIASSITELERVIGAQLVIRRPAHGVALTPTGRVVLNRAVQLIRDATELQREVAGTPGVLRGPVSLGTHISLAADLLPDLMQEFSGQHPEVGVSFSDNTMDLLIESLDGGELDCVISYASAVPPRFERRVLFSTHAHVVLPAAHPLAGRTSIDLGDLRATPLILLDLDPNGIRTLELLAAAGVSPHIAHQTWNHELAWSLVGRGLGYTVMLQRPRLRLDEGAPALRAIPIEGIDATEEVVAFWPAQVEPNRRVAALIATAGRLWAATPEASGRVTPAAAGSRSAPGSPRATPAPPGP